MIVKVDDPQSDGDYELLASLQDLDTLKAIFKSNLCRHNGRFIDNTDEAIAIIDVVSGSSIARWRICFEKNAGILRDMIKTVKGTTSDLPETFEELESRECIYSISFKRNTGPIRHSYGGFGVLFREDVGDYLGISNKKGRELFDLIAKKD